MIETMADPMPSAPAPTVVRLQIQGHPWDLWGLKQLFEGDPRCGLRLEGAVKPEGAPRPRLSDPVERQRFQNVGHHRVAILMADAFQRATSGEVHLQEMARDGLALITRLNGVGKLLDPEYYGVRLVTVSYTSRDGSGSIHVAEATPNKAFTHLDRHPTYSLFLTEALAAAKTDRAIAFVLEAWTLPISWASLYLILDCIESTMGGRDELVKAGLATRADLKAFAMTANNERDFRTGIRHGAIRARPVEETRIPLHEGHRILLHLTRDWLEMRLDETSEAPDVGDEPAP